MVSSIPAGSRLLAEDLLPWSNQINSLTNPGWTAYTPVWTGFTTNPVLGNGSIAGRYRKSASGDIEFLTLRLLTGSTTTYGSGFFQFSLPASPNGPSATAVQHLSGAAVLLDASTGNTYPGAVRIFNGLLVVGGPSGSLINSTVPFTWAQSDEVKVGLFFEPA